MKKRLAIAYIVFFIDNGLLRFNEFDQVLHTYKDLGLDVKGIDARKLFYDALKGEADPERKRKIIGKYLLMYFNKLHQIFLKSNGYVRAQFILIL